MQKLVIFLHDIERPDWVIIDNAGQVSHVVLQGEAAALAAEAKDRMVIVVVPGEDVLLTNVVLPKMSRSRLLQAIPFALEEQVIEDVETMHFAAGEYHADAETPVMVVSRAKMDAWMMALKTNSVTPDVMIPSIFALPYSENNWHAQINAVAVVRTSLTSGFACDKNNAEEMIALALSAAANAPQAIDVVSAESVSLSLPVTVNANIMNHEQQVEAMARQAAETQALNLLQGEYQNKKARGLPKMTSMVKIAAYLGAALLALLFLYPVVSFMILDQRARDIKDQIAVIYKRQFPKSTSIVAPKDRMQEKLNKLNSGVTDDKLLMMMASIGKGLSQASGVTLKRMDYQNNVMTLEITAATSAIFSGFTDALSQQGLRVKQENANLSGARVNATLEIE